MGRGSYVRRQYSSTRYPLVSSSDVQRFLHHPKPKCWLNALENHPALQENVTKVKEIEDIPVVVAKNNILEEETTVFPEPTENIEEEVTIEDHDDICDYAETIYDKSELVTAIDQWITKISNPDIIPWSEDELGGNTLLRKGEQES